MAVNPDFSDLLRVLRDAEARFIVVGAYAVIHYTEPRYTKDLDLWVEPTTENAKRVFSALAVFGAPVDELTLEDLENPQLVYQIGIEPNRIDLLMAVGGLDFERAFRRAEMTTYGGVPIRVLALPDLMAAKRAAGRAQDAIDLELLEKARARRE